MSGSRTTKRTTLTLICLIPLPRPQRLRVLTRSFCQASLLYLSPPPPLRSERQGVRGRKQRQRAKPHARGPQTRNTHPRKLPHLRKIRQKNKNSIPKEDFAQKILAKENTHQDPTQDLTAQETIKNVTSSQDATEDLIPKETNFAQEKY